MGNMQTHIFELINAFLEEPFHPHDFQPYTPPETFVKERGSIRLEVPRGKGSSTVARKVCHEFNCLVVCPNYDQANEFRATYMSEYDEDQPPTVVGIYSLKENTTFTSPDINLLAEIKQALDRSDVILCEVFRAYSNNKGIKRLFRDAGFSHRFILI